MKLTFEELFVSSNPKKCAGKHGGELDRILRKQAFHDDDGIENTFVTKDIRPKILATNENGRGVLALDVDFVVPEIQPKSVDPYVLTVNVHTKSRKYSFRHFLPSHLTECYVVDSTPVLVPNTVMKLFYVLPVPYLVIRRANGYMHVYELQIQISDELYNEIYDAADMLSRCDEMTAAFEQTLQMSEKNISPANAGDGQQEKPKCHKCGLKSDSMRITNMYPKIKIYTRSACDTTMGRCSTCG